MSALPPSAAIVRAVRQIVRAPSGNFSNSFSAAFSQETGRVLRVSAIRYSAPSISSMLLYLTTGRNYPRQQKTMFAYSPVRLNAVVDGETDPYGTGLLVTGNYFSELGVNALIGRTITPDDDRVQGAHPVAVISFNFWKRRFAQSAAVLNRTILLAGTRFTIIGVTPPEFFGTEVGTSPDFFVPVMMQVQVMPGMTDFIKQDRQRNSWLHVMGRLKPGISEAQALASLQSAYEQIQGDSATWYAEKFGSLKNWECSRLE